MRVLRNGASAVGYIKTAKELRKIYGAENEHPRFSRSSWKIRVALDQTDDGYWEWISWQLLKEYEAMSEEERHAAKKRDIEHLVEIGYYPKHEGQR